MINKVKELRSVIRYHRDQIGDDRCWIDDFMVWNVLPETKQPPRLPKYEEGMKQCRLFFKHRNADQIDKIPKEAILDKTKWDQDLNGMSQEQLRSELTKIKNAIIRHKGIINRERTKKDDEELYSILPEKIPADFRLPCEEDFLGTKRTNAGCPQFWKSHEHCQGEHNIHQWGPCKNGHR
ncbi:MAG TPA: hypothetical protein VJA18_07430 [Candidatus Nanoarchaeia archaeon]|nr:hypothetical protein [Candidatus Nanoarchaeia archaeon]